MGNNLNIYDPFDGDPIPSFNSFSDTMMQKACVADVLGEDREVITRTGGFFLRESDGIFFYTCWHSITGIDFLTPRPLAPPARRRYLRIRSKDTAPTSPNVAIPIGGTRIEEVDLYDADGRPAWRQATEWAENADVETLGFKVPANIDVVRIPVTLPDHIADLLCFELADLRWFPLVLPGNDVAIMGFPYGFSIDGDESPSPLLLKRSIAANTRTVFRVVLDGFAFQVMSGSPVLYFHKNQWWLYGI